MPTLILYIAAWSVLTILFVLLYSQTNPQRRDFFGKLTLYLVTYGVTLAIIPYLLFYTLLQAAWRVLLLPHHFINSKGEVFRTEVTRSVPAVLLVAALITSLASLFTHLGGTTPDFRDWGEGWLQNFSTEMFGAYLTYLLFEILLGEKERYERRREGYVQAMTRFRLADDLRQQQAYFAEMVALDWLVDGDLSGMDLRQIHLRNADLTNTDFTGANLQGVDFTGAKIIGAVFRDADLRGAHFSNLRWSITKGSVNFKGAQLEGAVFDNLEQAIRTRLIGINNIGLRVTLVTTEIVLPDGSFMEVPEDIQRFTESPH
ncbi:MAG: hypothetical protein OHK0046_11640 [Anaerolineae bacterium]